MGIASGLIEASWKAIQHLIQWLAETKSVARCDAYMLASVVGDFLVMLWHQALVWITISRRCKAIEIIKLVLLGVVIVSWSYYGLIKPPAGGYDIGNAST